MLPSPTVCHVFLKKRNPIGDLRSDFELNNTNCHCRSAYSNGVPFTPLSVIRLDVKKKKKKKTDFPSFQAFSVARK